MIFKTSSPDWQSGFWLLRHFVGMAAIYGVAQFLVAWYVFKNAVPKYLIHAFLIMVILFQLIFGIAVIVLYQGLSN